jgi:hypothetical protein
MPTYPTPTKQLPGDPQNKLSEQRRLSPAAERALAEAAERRVARERTADQPKEVSGRTGPEPTRYGDWEVNGLASDF